MPKKAEKGQKKRKNGVLTVQLIYLSIDKMSSQHLIRLRMRAKHGFTRSAKQNKRW